jgi:L-fuculose-phosphate aldolase
MHLAIYRQHARVQAIVHAHPPTAAAFAAARKPINVRLLAESYAILGEPAIAPYARMGSPELAACVADRLEEPVCCILMENHGVLCIGDTLLQAFDRIEVLENAARIHLHVAQLGGGVELNPEQLRELDEMMGRCPPG